MKHSEKKILNFAGKTIKMSFLFLSVLTAFFWLTGCSGLPGGNMEAYTKSFFAMDTYMTFTIYGEGAEAALTQAEDRIMELEGLWSVTDTGSDIYAVNHSDGQPVAVLSAGTSVSFMTFLPEEEPVL